MPTQSNISWQRAPIPWDQFPAGSGGGLRLGQPWKWFVAQRRAAHERTLFAMDHRKEEYRIWQCHSDRDCTSLLLRVEHHGAAPGWHAHSPGDAHSAFLGERHSVSSEQFPAITAAGLWRHSSPEERKPLFPAEPISGETLDQLSERLDGFSEDLTFRPVPFGLAIGMPERLLMGDGMAIYVSQLGRENPVFRLEDDGTTIPVLQSAGALRAADYVLPHDILGPHTRGRVHFSPEMRTLFTPYFPADELAGRVGEFAQALSSYAAILNAHEGSRGGRGQNGEQPGNDTTVEPAPENEKRDGSALPDENAWTRAASYVTV